MRWECSVCAKWWRPDARLPHESGDAASIGETDNANRRVRHISGEAALIADDRTAPRDDVDVPNDELMNDAATLE
jgi:hypothetical protein